MWAASRKRPLRTPVIHDLFGERARNIERGLQNEARNHEPQRSARATGGKRRRENKAVSRARDWLQQRAERIPIRHRTAYQVDDACGIRSAGSFLVLLSVCGPRRLFALLAYPLSAFRFRSAVVKGMVGGGSVYCVLVKRFGRFRLVIFCRL